MDLAANHQLHNEYADIITAVSVVVFDRHMTGEVQVEQ